ncbi:hypothetical protein SDC9_04157 [bioreactor metagenome]|uniref:Uncharacterized protein n=1 Tax=bioreactor metagenome TaxID=1076179 RepID=A0A644SVI5_9ZZZZ|nr:hypothetical protein [Negativicutes bacterium]MEA4828938.1 hypothetical protein [Enterococcus thailandicus]
MRVPFRTTIEEELVSELKKKAVNLSCNANDIIEDALRENFYKNKKEYSFNFDEMPYDKQFSFLSEEFSDVIHNVIYAVKIMPNDEVSDAIHLLSKAIAKLTLADFNRKQKMK